MDSIAAYHATTSLIEGALGSDKLAHVHVGLAIYAGAQLLLRDRRASAVALMTVITLEVLNESMDRLYWGSWRLTDTLGDGLATIFWPAVLFGVGRFRRTRWTKRVPSRAARGAPVLASRSRMSRQPA